MSIILKSEKKAVSQKEKSLTLRVTPERKQQFKEMAVQEGKTNDEFMDWLISKAYPQLIQQHGVEDSNGSY